jgi:hypothetical protein
MLGVGVVLGMGVVLGVGVGVSCLCTQTTTSGVVRERSYKNFEIMHQEEVGDIKLVIRTSIGQAKQWPES